MTLTPTEREVSIGIIKAFVKRAEETPILQQSSWIKYRFDTLKRAAENQEFETDLWLRRMADQCANALFDINRWDSEQLKHDIQRENCWTAGTIHRFVFGPTFKQAA
jgi:hypothetical protein